MGVLGQAELVGARVHVLGTGLHLRAVALERAQLQAAVGPVRRDGRRLRGTALLPGFQPIADDLGGRVVEQLVQTERRCQRPILGNAEQIRERAVHEAHPAGLHLKLEHNRLEPSERGSRAVGTGRTEELDVGLVLRAIGYRGAPVTGVPFHDAWGIIPNEDGRVTEMDGIVREREYVVGWAKRGPTGLIGTNKNDSAATVDRMPPPAAAISV